MADIAFLLLIFFLAATTIYVNTGISKKISEKPTQEISINIKGNLLDTNKKYNYTNKFISNKIKVIKDKYPLLISDAEINN